MEARVTTSPVGVSAEQANPPPRGATPAPADPSGFISELPRATGPGPVEGITPVVPDWVVPLQPLGAGTPVFVFPAGHNELRALEKDARMASHVGQRHPFWGLRRNDPHFVRARAVGVPVIAAECVAEMRTIQGSGPFLLYANCAGGFFAWKTARQLLAAGDEVAGMLYL